MGLFIFVFFFKQNTAYDITYHLVGSEMSIINSIMDMLGACKERQKIVARHGMSREEGNNTFLTLSVVYYKNMTMQMISIV